MSVELKDFRGKITTLTWCYLEAEHRATGEDQSEIVRDILHLWAERKHNAAIEARKLLEGEGRAGKVGESKNRKQKGCLLSDTI
ncbi:MAG: hypothetical protein ACYC9K_01105 [Sulfuricaulis sp.]